MWRYDRALNPPAPFLGVLIYPPLHRDMARQVRAKLDTGADVSAIPITVTHALRLHPESYILLGRDVLNHFYARLNDPELTFDLRVEPPA